MIKCTTYLESRDVQKLFAAGYASRDIGAPFDTLLTINLEACGIAPLQCHQAWSKMLQAIKRLHERFGLPWAFLWVMENSPANGLHVHCLLHRGEFAVGHGYRKLLLKPIGWPGANKAYVDIEAFHGDKTWEENIEYTIGYMCKGIRPRFVTEFNLKRLECQGKVPNKRWGVSLNLRQCKASTNQVLEVLQLAKARC